MVTVGPDSTLVNLRYATNKRIINVIADKVVNAKSVKNYANKANKIYNKIVINQTVVKLDNEKYDKK